ncbi:solute carrier family 35 member G1-like [Ciona intestinalis]
MVESRRYDLKRLAGLACGVIGAFLVALGAVVYQLTKDSTGVQVWFLRFVLMYFLTLPYITLKSMKQELPKMNFKSAVYLFAFGFVSVGASLTFYLSLDEFSAGDSLAISSSYLVITIALSYLFLKEKQHPIVIVLSIVSMVGVFLVARPTFIFGDNEEVNAKPDQNRALGIVYSILSAFFTAFRFTLGRKLNNTVHVSQMLIFTCTQALIAFPIYSITTNQGWYIPCMSDWGILIASALCCAVSNAVIALALQLERAGPVSIVCSLLIAFGFILEIVLLKTVPQVTSVVGALLVFLGSVGTIFVQMKFSHVT